MTRDKLTKQQKLRKDYAPERWVLPHSQRIRTWSLTKKNFHWPAYLFLEQSKWGGYIMRRWIKNGI